MANSNLFSAVKIIHPELRGSEYRLWADFFRLIGSFVCECTLKENPECGNFDIIIVIGNEDSWKTQKENVDKFLDWILKESGITEEDDKKYREKLVCWLKKKDREIPLKFSDEEGASEEEPVEFPDWINKIFWIDELDLAENDELDLAKKDESEWSEARTTYIKEGLDRILTWNHGSGSGADPDVRKCLETIAEIYVEYDIMQYRCLATYLNEESKIVADAKSKYVQAFVEIEQYSKDLAKLDKYVEYVKLELARRLTEMNYFLGEQPFFALDKLLAAVEELRKQYPDFYNLYVYQGMLEELDWSTEEKAAESYEHAIKKFGDQEYGVYVNYRLGRFYEKKRNEKETALYYYKAAYELNRHNYRTLFKLGTFHMDKQEWEDAKQYYFSILRELKAKEEENYLQQKEYEYLYKTHRNLGMIYEETGMYEESIQEYNKAEHTISMLDEKEKENRLFKEIFGSKAKDYLQCIKNRWPLDEIWERLYHIYIELGNTSEEETYYDKLMERRKRNE